MLLRNPIIDFKLIKTQIQIISSERTTSELFYELSTSIAKTEAFILEDTLSIEFSESFSKIIVETIALMCSIYGIEDYFDYIEHTSHYGNVKPEDDFEDHYKSLVVPFYKLRSDISMVMLHESKGISIKPLYQLAKFLNYMEAESIELNYSILRELGL